MHRIPPPDEQLAYRMAGSRRTFQLLPREAQRAIRSHASELHQLGCEVATAAARSSARVREGFVYIITTASHPGRLKIGSAVDVESRLQDAQTWDPARGFTVAHAVFVPDRNATERFVHETLRDYRLEGEWFAVPLATAKRALDIEASLAIAEAA